MLPREPQSRAWALTYLVAFLFAISVSFAVFAKDEGKDVAFDKALRSNDVATLMDWGERYERGEGVGQDTEKAVRLYCKAAAKGHLKANVQLGQLYAFGRGIYRDRDLAAAWFYEAARKKDAVAGNMLKVLKVKGKPTRSAECLLGPPVSPMVAKRHPAKGKVADLVRTLAPTYNLDPNLVLAVVEAESNFNPQALSPKNAQGLMQLIPATAERFGVEDVWDPEDNLRGGMAYLRWLLKTFKGDVTLALAAYNAGEGAVNRHGGVPPYAETRAYVDRIIARVN